MQSEGEEGRIVGLTAGQAMNVAGQRLNELIEARSGTSFSSLRREEWKNDSQIFQAAILTDIYCVIVQLNERLANMAKAMEDKISAADLQ